MADTFRASGTIEEDGEIKAEVISWQNPVTSITGQEYTVKVVWPHGGDEEIDIKGDRAYIRQCAEKFLAANYNEGWSIRSIEKFNPIRCWGIG